MTSVALQNDCDYTRDNNDVDLFRDGVDYDYDRQRCKLSGMFMAVKPVDTT